MSRKKGQGKNSFDKKPLHLMFQFEKGENAWAHYEVGLWRDLFEAAKTAPKQEKEIFNPEPNGILAKRAVKFTSRLLHLLQTCIETKKGTALRILADAIENPITDTVDPLRSWLVTRFLDLSKAKPVQIRQTSMRELQKEIALVLDNPLYDDRHIRRVCRELGITLSGKPGRPKK